MSVMALGCAGSETLLPFVVAITAFGAAYGIFHVARQSQTVALIRGTRKARALTTLAGVWRISNFIGPVVGSVIIHAYGLRWVYVFAAVVIAFATVGLVTADGWKEGKQHVRTEHGSTIAVARENRRILSTLGLAITLTVAVRAARIVALPLWAEHLGLSDGTASAIFAVSAGVDMLLFYPAGLASDRWGRRWSAVPSTAVLAVGFFLIPLSAGVVGLTIAAIVIGLGNGWGSGLAMTLGADLAPAASRSVFIGLWMVLTNLGSLVGPSLVSVGATLGLPVGIVGVGVVGLGASALLQHWIPPGRVRDP
jgi:MFS family permease